MAFRIGIKQNAAAQIPPEYYDANFYVWPRIKSSAYALEGYLPGDIRRLPNSDDPPISKHVSGFAVDIGASVIDFGSMWDPMIKTIAAKYNLHRPYENLRLDYANQVLNEWWHFERQ